jgi:hypothetical protein
MGDRCRARYEEMRIHGVVSPEVTAWIRQFGGAVTQYDHHVTGVVRPARG